MAEKDIETKNLESYPDVFADIFNVLLFKEDRIQPSQLKDGQTETIYKDASGKNKQQNRDEVNDPT